MLDDFEEYIENLKSEFLSIIDGRQQKDSQWIFIKIISSNIFLYDVTDERARSYIKSSPFISKSIVNIQNNDNSCFHYSILAQHIEQDHKLMKNILTLEIKLQNYQMEKHLISKILNFLLNIKSFQKSKS